MGGRSELPRVIAGRYRLEHEIAEGGMGVVYRAHQLDLERDVAIKLVSPRVAEQDPSFAERFHLEAASLARLSHSNVVTVHDYGRTEAGELFIVMELIEGAPLSAVVDRDGPLSFTRALRISLDIARALRAAHAIGVVHRDLKPANVMITRDEDERDLVKVLDFGLAKLLDQSGKKWPDVNLTQTPTLLGSPKYMAPEQACGDPAAPSADIYSLGAVMYFMAAGTTPFQGVSASEIVRHHLKTPVPPLHLTGYRRACPPELEALIGRCLEKIPADRFASMQEVIGAVKAVYGAVSRHAAGMSIPPEPAARRFEAEQVIVEEPDLSESGYKAIDPALLEDRGFLARQGEPTSPFHQTMPPQQAAFNSIEVPLQRRPRGGSRRRKMLAGLLAGVALSSIALGIVANQVTPRSSAMDPASTEARVRFDSTPAGAKVSEKGNVLGVTPFVAILPRTGESLHKFTLEKAGYLPTIIMIALDRPKLSVQTELEAVAEPK